MANSKSNIYPIQLQGAELNLNKLDAEIKQYSGFNKNNSPFVGGCLSNVFTKEEQISGGNADNTYIDTNGDVYRVDTEGLWKNEQKVITYPSTAKFYKRRRVDMPSNVVKALNESVYITRENDIVFPDTHHASGFIAHWGDGHTAILSEEYSILPAYLDISAKGNSVVFSYKRYIATESNLKQVDTHFIICPDINESFYKDISDATYQFGKLGFFLQGDAEQASQSAYIIDENNYVLAINYEYAPIIFTNSPNIIALVTFNNSSVTVKKYKNTDFSLYDSGNIIQESQNIYKFYPSKYLSDWYMTDEGLFYYKKTRTYRDDVVFDLSSYKVNYPYFKTALVLRLNFSQSITVEEDVILGSRFQITSDGGNVHYNYTEAAFRPTKGIYTPHYVFCAGVFYACSVSGPSITSYKREYYFSLSGTFANQCFSGYTADQKTFLNDIPSGGVVCKDNFKILINNNNVSGISVADFYIDNYIAHHREGKSFNGVLIEEWNSIDDFAIFNNKLLYSKNGVYYCVEEGTPSLFRVLNQIVCNCNYEQNSYDIRRDVVLHFASDWNNAWLTNPGNTNFDFTMHIGPSEDKYFIASAVNEYNLENNASLILNMVSCLFDLQYFGGRVWWKDTYSGGQVISTTTYYEAPSNFVENYLNTGGVDFYSGLMSDNKAIYNSTPTKEGFINSDLIGLPYPNDANGNIQYSPSIFAKFVSTFGNDVFVKEGSNVYQLMKSNNQPVLSFYLGTLVENLNIVFILQGQYYGVINDQIFAISFNNGVVASQISIVSVKNLQFVGNTPYEALFFSKTNRCLYSFTGANVLNQKQLVDKISEVRNYLYNPATQTVFLITDIGVLFYGLFGMFLLEYTNITNIFLLDNGIVMSDNSGNYRYIKYYLDEGDTDYTKENIRLETCFYGMNNEVVTINDCLYFRLFSEEHEEGNLKVKATTISLKGRQTEETTFKIKASDWDKITHTIYLRYQPKTQRGLGVSFSIDSPFKIASMSVGSQPDAVLVDRVSKGAITAPSVTTNNNEW